MKQNYLSERFGAVVFEDKNEMVRSSRCHPRDIVVIVGEDCRALREEIAIDIRIGSGESSIGVARNLKHV